MYVGADNLGQTQLFLQSLGSATPLQLTHVPSGARYPVFSPDSSRIYYLGQEKSAREVWSVSPGGGAPEMLLPGMGGSEFLDGLAVSRDGTALVVARLEDSGKLPMSLWISSPPGAEPRKYPGTPLSNDFPYARSRLRFSPDGKQLLAMQGATGYEAWILHWPPTASGAGGRRVFPQISEWGAPTSADWMPDRSHLVLSETDGLYASGRLWTADIETGKLTPLSAADANSSEPMVSPLHGRILLDEIRGSDDAVEIPLDGTAPRELVATSRDEREPAWSPAGDQFVYVTNRRGDEEIWIASRREGWQRPLVTQNDLKPGRNYSVVAPVWSPDGSRIAYGREGIWISPAAGGPPTRILPVGHILTTWSPDGAWIAFLDTVNNKIHLAKQKVRANTPPIRIAEAAGRFRPAWSPDGNWITMQFAEGFGLISPDGMKRNVIFRGTPGIASACAWSRDSSTLYLDYMKGQELLLSGFSMATGTERKIGNMGMMRFTYVPGNSVLLSEASDGKSLAASISRLQYDIWIIEGVSAPPDFWHRLLWRPQNSVNPKRRS